MPEKTIKLDYPVNLADGTELTELTVKVERLKVRDQIEVQELEACEAEYEVRLMGKVFGVNPEDLKEIDMRDYRRLREAMMGFLSSGRR